MVKSRFPSQLFHQYSLLLVDTGPEDSDSMLLHADVKPPFLAP
jgi:hypothetical protein